jgi:WD40 repeat protein
MLIIFRIIYMTKNSIFTIGGTVQAGSGIYLTRQADEDLLAGCLRGAFTYVLTPRQMGKSSLMVATAERLRSQGVRCVIIDLQGIGVKTTAEQWYLSLLDQIQNALELRTDVKQWWKQYPELSVTYRLTQFFKKVLLVEVKGPVTIFLDEIDSTLSLDFTDDFFAAIRYLFVARAQEVALKQLSFVLIGVATPGDLIRDPERTPFNIGQRLDLTDFTLAESSPLMDGLQKELGLSAPQARKIMKEILYWTEGHPYLTQKLCVALVEASRRMNTALSAFMRYDCPLLSQSFKKTLILHIAGKYCIKQVMRQTFLGQKSNQDNNLQFVRDMLTRRSLEPEIVLRTYQDIRRGELVLDDEQSSIYSHLKLSGVVWRKDKHLRVRNPIYKKVFNEEWIWENLPENLWRRNWSILKRNIPVITILLLGFGIAANLYQRDLRQTLEAQQQILKVQQQSAEQLFAVANNDLTSNNFVEAAVKVITAYRLSRNSKEEIPSSAYDTLSNVILNIRELNRIEHKSGVSAIAVSEDGKTIASGDRDGNLRVWYAANGKLKYEKKHAHSQAIYSVAFSEKKYNKIVSGGNDKKIRIWNAETGIHEITTFKDDNNREGHTNEVFSVAFSPDGEKIVSGSLDKTIRLWSTKTGKQIKEPLIGHTDAVFSVAFSPDGKKIVSGSWDKTVRLWNVADQKEFRKQVKKHASRVYAVAFSPDGKIIASASKDKEIKLWNADTVENSKPKHRLPGSQSNIYSLAFSHNSKKIVSGSWDKTVRLWNVQDGKPERIFWHNDVVYSVAFSHDDKRVFSGSLDKTLRIWEIDSDEKSKPKKLKGHTDSIHSVDFSPDGKKIISGSWDKTVKLWNTMSGELEHTFLGADIIYTVAFSPEGKVIASGSNDKKINLWDANTYELKNTLTGHNHAVYSIAFSPDGKKVVSGSWDNTIRLWDIMTDKPDNVGKILNPDDSNSAIDSVAFSPDGKTIISGANDSSVKLWNLTKGKPTEIGRHEDTVHSVAFSPDGKTIVSGSLDQTIQFWDAVTVKKQNKTIDSHKSVVYRVAYSPDGKKIISSSRDGVIRLWDTQTKEQIGHPFKEHKDAVYAVAFSPDGKTIVSGSEDSSGDLLLWKLPDDKKLNLQLTLCQKLANHNLLKDPQTDNAKAAKKYCDEIITKK